MRIIFLSLTILLSASWTSSLTLSSFFGGEESHPEVPVTSEELAPVAAISIEEHHKPEKPEKPHKPFLPEIFKPLKKPEVHKPVKKPLKKPVKKPIKKPIKKPHKKPVKKPVKKPEKPCSIFSHIPLPSLPSFGKLPHKLTEKLPHKKVIKITKTEYVEVTKRQTVHPVCYISLKHKKPCIKEHHNDEDYDEAYDQEQNYDLQVQVEEDKGEIVPTATVQVIPTLNFNERHGKLVNTTQDVSLDVEPEQSQDDNETYENEEPGVGDEEVDETAEYDREGRYIKFKEQPAPIDIFEDEEEEDFELEPSEDIESRINKKKEFVTKTILVTRLEKYTDNHVTATVIAKNCAPVTPHVPPCKKKHNAAVIRDRPDDDTPLVIVPVASVVAPPEVTVDAKEIVNDEVEDNAEDTVEEPEKADDISDNENVTEESNDQIQIE